MSSDAVHLGTDIGAADPLVSPQQKRAFTQSTARTNIAWGPVRSGKSVGLEFLRWFEFVATTEPKGGEYLMAGKTLKSLERNVLRPMQRWFGASLVEWSRHQKEATIAGQRVELEGANDEGAVEKVTGMTLRGAVFNEITLFPENFFNQTLARLSVPGAKLFGTTNPAGPYHWLKEKYLDREEELGLRQWRFRLEDNIFLDPSYVEALKAEYTGMWYKRYILGLWVLAAGAIYQMFSQETHVRELPEHRRRQIDTFIVDCDYGTSNPTTFSLKGLWHEECTGGRERGFAHAFREHYHDGRKEGQKTDAQHAQDLIDWLPARIGERAINPTIYCDPSAQSFITELEERGFDVVEAENDVIDGIRFVSSMLDGEAAADGWPRLTFDPSCEETPKEYSSYVWDEKAQKRGEDKPLKERDHTCDRDRYGLFTTLHDPDRTEEAFGSILSAN
jgi:PBSX family phage terminase large subunit